MHRLSVSGYHRVNSWTFIVSHINYVNGIGYSCKGNVLSFADATTLYTSHSNLTKLHENPNEQTDQWFIYHNYAIYNISENLERRVKCMVGRFYQTSNSYGDLELRSRRFHFDLVYFENLERRIKCNLINPFRERLLRNSTSNPSATKNFEVDGFVSISSTSKI